MSDHRRINRLPCHCPAVIKARGADWKVYLAEISIHGCSAAGSGLPYRTGDRVRLAIAHLAPIPAIVVHASVDTIGFEFEQPLHIAVAEHIAEIR